MRLLALNATFGVARVQEHERGFAVSNEVCKLTKRTQKSLGRIESDTQALSRAISAV
ncbi:hypothetical protein [Helicobacter sp. NHP22-001]|uniref:hypothetical protein n=1 Tax=Helicobacter sp. NHP22-001 TaxID=3040202 RepID=UPI00244D8074|nr:hypothetical protein [Helicobacter sp. NHP22-001]GMB95862.1 hypothetical protein NHP22001_04510 [Helicobacter sp. NHP22-001]